MFSSSTLRQHTTRRDVLVWYGIARHFAAKWNSVSHAFRRPYFGDRVGDDSLMTNVDCGYRCQRGGVARQRAKQLFSKARAPKARLRWQARVHLIQHKRI